MSHAVRNPPRRVRLDRALSKIGAASRAEANRLIRSGRVEVDGRTIEDPGLLVVPDSTRIAVDGQLARGAAWRTIALHKPRGVVTTRRDPEGRPTVFDLLEAPAGDGLKGWSRDAGALVTVGRLDLASSGLLLLTTDTRLADTLTDPRNAVVRRYIVTARGEVTEDEAARMLTGIGGLRATHVLVRKRSRRETHLTIDLTTGKNREIRRLLDALGHEVTRLTRIAFGGIELGTLAAGQWRDVSRDEIRRAFPAITCQVIDPPGDRIERRRT